jgi:hypothetical protein
MPGEPQGVLQDRDKLGRMKRGYNPRISKRIRIEAKLEELRREYFPNGGASRMDGNRLRLAAAHYVDAESCRDPVTRQRATRVAEYLCAKLSKPQPAQLPSARELLDRLGKTP